MKVLREVFQLTSLPSLYWRIKMKLIICNAFSLSMIDREKQVGRDAMDGVRIPRPVSDRALTEYCRMMLAGEIEWESAVGHADTSSVFANELGLPILPNRVSVKLTDPSTRALVGQYVGPRLPEGATTLPEGATIEWWVV
jgi:hypothetical protein